MDDDFFGGPAVTGEGRATNVFDEVLVASQQPAAVPQQRASPSPVNDEPSPAEAPAAAAAPAPVVTPTGRTTTQSPASTAPEAVTGPKSAAYETAVANLLKTIADRTAAADKATAAKEEGQKKAGQAYIAEEKKKREEKLKIIRGDHRKAQSEYEKKLSELKHTGAVWSSLGLVVDLKNQGTASKKTERMRQVLLRLEAQQ